MLRRRSKAKPAARRSIDTAPKTVAVIGTGLIGASIGLAARAAGFKVIGWDVDASALRRARKHRALTHVAGSLREAVGSASIVVLAAPPDEILRQLPEVFEYARPGALVIDVAGVKGPVSTRASALLARTRGIRFAAGHPIAGSERSGPASGDAKLLDGRTFALHAPAQNLRKQAYSAAARFVRKLGAVPLQIAPRDHDRAIAALSALPQLTSIALALASSERRTHGAALLAGPGYRDATRLAESGFAMWKPALEANLTNVLRSVRALAKRVNTIEGTLRRRDWATLERLFSEAASERRRVNPR